ncbi:MAG: dolichyl-phosphate beta-D-mannosyltransferase [Thermoleophilia bacterium]|nr:MAG: dolichyl-phosphate beta-D-mannosyltransferase [Thermoleophilia bacterium]
MNSPAAERYIVCLPTYNECENLEPMIMAIAAARERAMIAGDVLVIDDGSPDGTGQIADHLAAEHDWVHVLHRTHKEGLGRAYLAGFDWALERDYAYILEMDCDFSHDPGRLPDLLAAAQHGADLVLGSRYVHGGGVRDWSAARRIISRSGCLYAQAFLQLGIHDLTGGFKCFRRAVLEAIDLADVTAEGYAFQIEMTYRTSLLGFRIEEIPITFTDRVAGGSKMSRRIVAEASWRVPSLRLRALRHELPRN